MSCIINSVDNSAGGGVLLCGFYEDKLTREGEVYISKGEALGLHKKLFIGAGIRVLSIMST